MTFLLQITFVFLLVLLNGFFVAAEFALVAIRKTRVEELARKGSASAKLVLTALNDLESYISSTQLGITLASLGLGWIGEPAIAHFIEPFFRFLPQGVSFVTAHGLAVIIAFTLITFLHIVLGELAPKTIALQRSESTALIIIAPLIVFTKVFKPFIWILNRAGSLILKLFGFTLPAGHQLVHSEDEIKMILSQSAEGGIIERQEVEMMNKVLQLGDIPVRHIMSARTEITAVDGETIIKEVKKIVRNDNLSRYPVYTGDIDNIIGYIHEKDLNKISASKNDLRLVDSGIIRKIISVPEIQRVDDVLVAMRKQRVHMAIVNDEYGGTAGIVTLEDVIESLIGEIYDEFDQVEPEIKKQKDGSYIIDGLLPVQQVRQRFNIPLKGQGYVTIGGVVFGLLGKEPQVGDKVEIGKIQFKVLEVERKRVKTLLVRRMPLT